MYIVLEKEDCDKIVDAIIEKGKSCNTTVEIDGLSFCVDFYLKVEYSREDDYLNGTGAYVCEDVWCSINGVWIDEGVAIDVDTAYIENEVENYFRNI